MAHDRPWRVAVVVSAATLALLAACTPGSDPSGPVTRASPAEEPTITPPPATTSPEADAAEEVEQAVLAYYARTDDLLSDAQLPIEQATDVATGAELDEVRLLLQQERANGRRQAGQAVVASLEITELNLTPLASTSARICLDVTGVDVIDAAGASVVLPDRQARSVVDLDLVEQDATGWMVERTAAEGVPCDE